MIMDPLDATEPSMPSWANHFYQRRGCSVFFRPGIPPFLLHESLRMQIVGLFALYSVCDDSSYLAFLLAVLRWAAGCHRCNGTDDFRDIKHVNPFHVQTLSFHMAEKPSHRAAYQSLDITSLAASQRGFAEQVV